MTLAEFSRTYQPIRYFQRYTAEQRADRTASFRLGPIQREQVGEYCYVHPLLPDRVFPSPSRARRAAHWHLMEQALPPGSAGSRHGPGRLLTAAVEGIHPMSLRLFKPVSATTDRRDGRTVPVLATRDKNALIGVAVTDQGNSFDSVKRNQL